MDKDVRTKKWRKYETTRKGEPVTYLVPISGEMNIGDLVKEVPIVNPADKIHVDTHDPKSDGYGGSTMAFTLEDGSEYKVKGPWHGGSFSFDIFRITDLHYTFVTIGTEHPPGNEWFMSIPEEYVIYQDPGWVLGPFMRGERLARQLADVLNQPLYLISESYGGASAHWVKPGQKMHVMAKRGQEDD